MQRGLLSRSSAAGAVMGCAHDRSFDKLRKRVKKCKKMANFVKKERKTRRKED